MDKIAEALVLGLAVWHSVEILHHSRLFHWPQVWSKERVDSGGFLGFFAKLYYCPFCLGTWVAIIYAASYYAAGNYFYWWILAMAGIRIANVLNDLLKPHLNGAYRYEPDVTEPDAGQSEAI